MKITLPLFCTSFSLLLGWMQPLPAIAGRYVFNQTPETIEKSFGRYWTKKTFFVGDDRPKQIIQLTYSPTGLRRTFPEFPNATLRMNYSNNRVVEVSFLPGNGPETSAKLFNASLQSPSEIIQKKAIEARFFRYILGYNSGLYKPLHYTGGNSGESFSTCLGDGVVSDYFIDNLTNQTTTGEPLIGSFSLSYTTECSRPYDKIKFTQDLLGG
ncbi:MAG: hypothetical protein HC824_08880 [Synechococcales cyanobacterium RM1_1_8]|nr:hypothetical protein [Synechococcales cyanobacterium RM1_1_8]